METFPLTVFFVIYRVYDTIRFSNSCIFNHLDVVFVRSHVTEAGFEIAL